MYLLQRKGLEVTVNGGKLQEGGRGRVRAYDKREAGQSLVNKGEAIWIALMKT